MSIAVRQVQRSGARAAGLDERTGHPERHDARTLVLLEAPMATTLVKLAAPNVLVTVAQSAIGLIATSFVGRLGTDALAGVALVLPVVMLVQHAHAARVGTTR